MGGWRINVVYLKDQERAKALLQGETNDAERTEGSN